MNNVYVCGEIWIVNIRFQASILVTRFLHGYIISKYNQYIRSAAAAVHFFITISIHFFKVFEQKFGSKSENDAGASASYVGTSTSVEENKYEANSLLLSCTILFNAT